MNICKIDKYGYWTGESKEITEQEGAAPGWVFADPPIVPNGEWASWQGPASGWLISASGPQVAIESEIQSANFEQAKKLLADTDYLDLPNTNPVNKQELIDWRASIRAIVINPPITVVEFPTKPTTVWVAVDPNAGV